MTTALRRPEWTVAPPRAGGGRDESLDVAKGVLIVLVVAGHALPSDWPVTAAIYLFHMPAFAFLSGVLTRGAPLTVSGARTLVRRLAIPVALFQLLYVGFGRLLAPDSPWPSAADWFVPGWPLWYLVALLVWRLITPLLLAVRAAPIIAAAVAILAGGETLPFTLALNRIVGLLPFFALGLMLRPSDLAAMRTASSRSAAAAVLAAAAVVAVVFGLPERRWLEWSVGADALGVSPGTGMAWRAALLLIAGLLSWAVLALLPSRWPTVAAMGVASMYPLLLHRFAVQWSTASAWGERVEPWVLIAVVFLASIGFVAVSTSPPVRRLLRPLVEPRADWLFRSDGEARTAGRHGSG